jgi:3-hydroxyisobutyrate dehydrogenase
MAESVAIIGLGAMGAALFARAAGVGAKIRAYDVDGAKQALCEEQGAMWTGSPADAAHDARYVHVFVRTDEEVISAVLGPDGVLQGANDSAIVFLHSTISPETTRRVAGEANRKGITVMDAPVTSVPRQVLEGKALFLVGGADDVVAAHLPYLESLGARAIHFGPLGAGNIAKIAKNMMNAAERVVISEAMEIAEAGGLDVAKFMEMAVSQDNGSAISRWERAFAIDGNHPVPKPSSNIMEKDIGLAADLVEALGLAAPVTRGAAATGVKWMEQWERE